MTAPTPKPSAQAAPTPAAHEQSARVSSRARYCLNVHADMLCDGPQGHDGGCTFVLGWMLARRIEDDCIAIAAYAGDTTNELRGTRDDRDEGWRQHNQAEIGRLNAEARLARAIATLEYMGGAELVVDELRHGSLPEPSGEDEAWEKRSRER